MRVLAFDTTVSACSVALWCDGAVEAKSCQAMMHGQAEALVPEIEAVLRQAHCSYEDIDRIAVTIGPGSFTGVRVGLAAARGMGVATGQPVIGVATTKVMAEEARLTAKSQPIIVAIDARRAELYLHRFDSVGTALSEPACMLPEEAAALLNSDRGIVVGDGAEKLMPLLGDSYTPFALTYPDPAVLADMASRQPVPTAPPGPLYVRPPDAALPKSGGRLRP